MLRVALSLCLFAAHASTAGSVVSSLHESDTAYGPFFSGSATSAEPRRPQQGAPVFRATLDRVRVDLIATDADGRFVDDLRPHEFVVYEDGIEQEILSMQLVDIVSEATGGAAVTRGGEPAERDVGAETAVGSSAEAFGAVVYLVDFPGLDHRIKLRLVEEWERLLASTDDLRVPQAVYVIDNAGRLREMAPLSTDIDVLRKGVRAVGDTGLTVAPGKVGSGGHMQRHARSRFTFEVLRAFADALAARPGRTALVWVSAGVTLEGPSTRGASVGSFPGHFPNKGVLDEQRRMHRAANSANASIYAVDPSRWVDLLGTGTGIGSTGSVTSARTRVGSARDEMHDSLREAAAETGGQAFILQADLGDVLREIEEQSGRYYLLTYAAPPPIGDGDYHEIEVETSRPGVRLQFRRGYVDYSAEERRNRFVSAALSLPGIASGVPIEVESLVTSRDRDEATLETVFSIDAAALGERAMSAAEAAKTAIEIHAVVLDDELEIIDELHGEFPAVSADLRKGTALRDEPLTYEHRWRLAPGEYDLRVMVHDRLTGRTGARSVPLTVPASSEPIREAALGLVAAGEARRGT